MTALLRYDIARQAIAEAVTFDEVRDWEDKAAAVKEYGRRIKDRSLVVNAMKIEAEAHRRRGQLLAAMKKSGELADGRPKAAELGAPSRMTLKELGVTKDESARDQKIAALDSDSFSRLIERCRAHAEANPDVHSFDVLKPPPEGGINGARAVMGSRQEPDDSLDFFPTPPWATRALIERVMPVAWGANPHGYTGWEPACGEGHIAQVLLEYFGDVAATDVHDYGYGFGPFIDFLNGEWKAGPNQHDWIITNPPFGDKAIQFVHRALDLATVGVAMFFRSQWAVEGIERYESIFRDRPPTLCAFFVERVNLCKGRWDPDGTTATAYCWLVWVKGRDPLPPFWIPPGCRTELTKPDDRARFAAWSLPPHDPQTGEIAA